MSKRKYRRRKYLVDYKIQLKAAAATAGVLLLIGVMCATGIAMIPADSLDALDASGTRTFFITTMGIYYVLASGILAVVAMLVMHRIVGPVLVFKRAIRSMRNGDYSERLELRKRDGLHDLADEIGALRELMRKRDGMTADMVRCMDEGDFEGARELADELRPKDMPEPENSMLLEPSA